MCGLNIALYNLHTTARLTTVFAEQLSFMSAEPIFAFKGAVQNAVQRAEQPVINIILITGRYYRDLMARSNQHIVFLSAHRQMFSRRFIFKYDLLCDLMVLIGDVTVLVFKYCNRLTCDRTARTSAFHFS